MIGVIANRTDHGVIREFFELFKTPWEFYRDDGQYDVLLCAGDDVQWQDTPAKLVVVYAGQKIPLDEKEPVGITGQRKNVILSYKQSRFPIYGNSITFQGKGISIVIDEASQQTAAYINKSGRIPLARIGYDIYQYLRQAPVRELFKQHSSGRNDNHKILFSLFLFEEWLRAHEVSSYEENVRVDA